MLGAAGFMINLPQSSPAFAEVQDKVYVQPERPDIPGLVVSPADPLQKLTARSAIVMDAATGQVLYERDIDTRRYPASTRDGWQKCRRRGRFYSLAGAGG